MNLLFPTRRNFTAGALALIAAGSARAAAPSTQWLLFGGPICTGTGTAPAEALLMRNGKVAFVGSLAEARRLKRGALEIDLGGRAAFPGFIDSHVHLVELGLLATQLDLVGVPSIEALKAQLAVYAKAHPVGPIIGRGWIETHWPEKRFPTRADLDAVVNDRPVFLTRIDGHAAIANSAALALGGINTTTPDPAGGQILRGPDGSPTGMLIDNAQSLVESKLPAPTRAMKRDAAARAVELYAERGWTGAHHMSATMEDVSIFEELARDNKLPFPVDVYLASDEAESVFARGPYALAQGMIGVRGIKLYMDGALGSRGAALLATYNDVAGSGLLVTPVEEIRALLKRARQSRIQVATHAIGDRGNRLVLDAYEATFADDPAALKAARWRIEHAQVLSPEDLPRFARLGVIASMQPSHCISDMYFAPARLGPARLKGAYAWKSLLDSGAVVAAGTDAPVEKGDPLIEFYAASYRHALNGFAGPDWHLEEAVSRERALRMLTSGGAYASFRERERGTLEPGMRADVSVFSADLMTAPFPDIAKAHALRFRDLALEAIPNH